ncbi:MarR family winged helix-turn-helix transcriptional regulator [Mycolicibacterium mengxianglii]|uniref:MarR family winged helix-turn-helix transcriptional regulator n=1 Tax=Mycolicibacterium mengxianglii TaxID=2736649 RepID=UPI0018D1B794|nr:MarR family winged helix-turn-helix transcriptional regulator [Mycolicibacterium mengxianglii]
MTGRSTEGSRGTDGGELTPSQQRAWVSYMRVYHRLEYEMNRHLQHDCGMSLGDYTVLTALSNAPGRAAQLSSLATVIGWERSRLSHHLQRMDSRGLIDRLPSEDDGRATDVALTEEGWQQLLAAAPKHAMWVKQMFFSDVDRGQEAALADILATVYDTILRRGTLPPPDFGPTLARSD